MKVHWKNKKLISLFFLFIPLFFIISCSPNIEKLASEGNIDELIKALGDSDIPTRVDATFALADIGQPAVDPLLSALEDENEDIRANAAEALGMIGEKRAE
ncbi:MAG: HEAT repeat domain-containing protein, partial [Anaerolineales bacterium]